MSFGIWQRTITDDAGNVLPGASIEVRTPSADFTGALVSLFSDEAGSTGLSNPFNADSEGFAQFYAAPRKVDIRATGSGSQRTWRNVEILGTAATADKQTSPTDATAGRLIPTEYGYYKGNILGTVSQSGGVPTGAIIERGFVSGQGYYTKFADGTMEVWFRITLTFDNAKRLFSTWTFPRSFSFPPRTFGTGAATTEINMTPNFDQITGVDTSGFSSNDSCGIRINRVSGQPDFVSGDVYEVSVRAIGRWYE